MRTDDAMPRLRRSIVSRRLRGFVSVLIDIDREAFVLENLRANGLLVERIATNDTSERQQ